MNEMFDEMLLEKNRDNHENAQCATVEVGKPVRGGRWIKRQEIGKEETVGYPVYEKGDDILLYPLTHALTIGSTGTGKTEVLYNNMIRYYGSLKKSVRPSMNIFDVKGDLCEKHAAWLREQGYRVLIFDARYPMESSCYNPLAMVYDSFHRAHEIAEMLKADRIGDTFEGVRYGSKKEACDKAKVRRHELMDLVDQRLLNLAEVIIPSNDPKNRSWDEGARTCARAILHTMLRDSLLPYSNMDRDHFTIANLCSVAFHTKDSCEPLIKWLERAEDIPCVKGALGACYKIKAQITRDGFIASLNAPLNRYSSISTSALTYRHDIDLREIAEGEEDFALFIIPNDRNTITASLSVMLLDDLIEVLSDHADRSPNHCLKKDFIVLADEFANFPAIPHMSEKITTLRSRRIWMQMAVQTLEQLQARYGTNEAEILIDNCDLCTYLGSNSAATKKRFAESFGKKMGTVTNVSFHADGSAGATRYTQDTYLIKCSDLDRLTLGEFYLYSRTCEHIKSYIMPYFMRPDAERGREEARFYNGYEDDRALYDIDQVLAFEEQFENEEEDDEEIDEVYLSDFDRAVTLTGFLSWSIGGAGNIARNLVADMNAYSAKHCGNESRKDELLKDNIFPEAIRRELASNMKGGGAPNQDPQWLACFKKTLFYDKELRQVMGKDKVLELLNGRIKRLKKLDLFSGTVVEAFEEVRNYIKNMGDEEYFAYAMKAATSSTSSHRSGFFS